MNQLPVRGVPLFDIKLLEVTNQDNELNESTQIYSNFLKDSIKLIACNAEHHSFWHSARTSPITKRANSASSRAGGLRKTPKPNRAANDTPTRSAGQKWKENTLCPDDDVDDDDENGGGFLFVRLAASLACCRKGFQMRSDVIRCGEVLSKVKIFRLQQAYARQHSSRAKKKNCFPLSR